MKIDKKFFFFRYWVKNFIEHRSWQESSLNEIIFDENEEEMFFKKEVFFHHHALEFVSPFASISLFYFRHFFKFYRNNYLAKEFLFVVEVLGSPENLQVGKFLVVNRSIRNCLSKLWCSSEVMFALWNPVAPGSNHGSGCDVA